MSIFRPLAVSVTIGLMWLSPALAQGLPEETPVARADLTVRKAGALLVDVRTPAEWAETGVPATAHTVMLQDPEFIEKIRTLVGGDTPRRVALICRSGNRSQKARDLLQDAGFKNVTSVTGGVLGPEGWLDLDLPVRPWSDRD